MGKPTRDEIPEGLILQIFNDITHNHYSIRGIIEKYGISRNLANNIRFMRPPWLQKIAKKYNLIPK